MKTSISKKFIFTLGAVLLTTLFIFSLLYKHDNKYTYDCPQAINGVLLLDDESYEKNSLLYLIDEWEFYQYKLLSPEDFISNTHVPDAMIHIGQYGGFELDDPSASPYGSATYRLNIFTGSGEQKNYMLELPEIFSAYKLWINGELLAESGVIGDSKDEYRPKTVNSSVTFRAADRIEIIIAVSNYSHYYSGMMYPPAFGSVAAVSSVINIKVVLSAMICFIAVTVGIFYLCFGSFLRNKLTAVCFGFLCFLYAGSVSYPLVHFINVDGMSFWYTVEDFCFYGFLLGIVCLHALICGMGNWVTKGFIGLCAVVCVISIIVPAFTLDGSARNMIYYSRFVNTYKIIVIGYLLIASLYAIERNIVYSKILLTAVGIFGVSLAVDAFVAWYEPIRLGWPSEIGGFALIALLEIIMTLDAITMFKERHSFAIENAVLQENAKHVQTLLSLQAERYQLLTESISEAKKARHDLRQHLSVMEAYIKTDDKKKLSAYFMDYKKSLHLNGGELLCENAAVNAVVNHYADIAREKGIRVNTQLALPENMGISDIDLCVVFGNCLENALEACERIEQPLKAEQKFIRLRANVTGHLLSINIQNSFDGQIEKNEDSFISQKRKKKDPSKADVGIGISSIQAIAAKYQGIAKFEADNNMFIVTILLRLPAKIL